MQNEFPNQPVSPGPMNQFDEPETAGLGECQFDALQHAAGSIQQHTNTSHHAQLRALAGCVSDQPACSIASAELVALCRHGFHISWLDLAGGHVVQVAFEHPAEDAAGLAMQLGAFLSD